LNASVIQQTNKQTNKQTKSKKEMLVVKGRGPKKVTEYGNAVLEVIHGTEKYYEPLPTVSISIDIKI
jgi:hypothetical protein